MKSPEIITHGTSSERDAEKIREEGFKAQEGRATVSADLIYSYEWATNKQRRKGSKSETSIEDAELGRMVIMKTPPEKHVDYATHTGIEVNEEQKEITGYSSKYESGRKQLAIYDAGDIARKRKSIEEAKAQIKEIDSQFSSFLAENGIDAKGITSKEALVGACKDKDLAIEKKIAVLTQAQLWEEKREALHKIAEPDVSIAKENILLSIIPSPKLKEQLDGLSEKIRRLEKVDFETITQNIAGIIEENDKNYIAPEANTRSIVSELLKTTLETEIVNMVRSLSMDVKRAQGFDIFNRDRDEKKEKPVDKEKLRQKIQRISAAVNAQNFDIGDEKLNRYLRTTIKALSSQAEGLV